MVSNGVEDKTKPAIVSSLSKRFSLDQGSFSSDSLVANDIKSLFLNILKLAGKEASLENNEELRESEQMLHAMLKDCTEHGSFYLRVVNSHAVAEAMEGQSHTLVMKWIAFADSFPAESGACIGVLKGLNEELIYKSVLLGYGLKPSEADIVVFSALHSFVSGLSDADRQKYPNVLRWIDYIQNKEDFGDVFKRIPVEKCQFEPQCTKNVVKVESDPNTKKGVQNPKTADKLEADSNSKTSEKIEADSKTKKGAAEKKVVGDGKATEKKKVSEKESVDKDADVSVSLLNIQVGLIRKAWKHPSADSLLVEEIDLGEGNVRQVVSGLAKFCNPDELTNRRVALITNVKPGKLRDVMSAGLVLCASSQDHTVVEPLLPPEGAKVGERVSISGHDGKPEDVLNPKKKQLDKITPNLYTDDKGIATFKGIPFMTSAGPCTSSIPNGSVK